MAQAPNALAAAGGAPLLPEDVQSRVASCLELYPGLPASTAVIQELLKTPMYENELCVHTIDATTRFVLYWTTIYETFRTQPAKRIMLIRFTFQEWL